MKLQIIAALFGLSLLSLPSSFAQEKKDPETPRRGPGQRPGQPGKPGQPGQRRSEMPTDGLGSRMGPMLRFLPLMKVLDTDEDGVLSKTEIENASKSIMKLDKDGDGIISAEELRPDPSDMPGAMAGAMPGRPGEGPQGGAAMAMRMFEQRDANGDGKLSGDEIPERMRDRLSVIDTNGDGSLDKSEVEKAMARMGDRLGGRPERGNDQNGQGVRPRRPPTDGSN